MRDALLLVVYVLLLMGGLFAPFILCLGYIWVDLAAPQQMGYSIMTYIPVSLIMGIAAIGMFFFKEGRSPFLGKASIFTILVFAGWVTLTTTWAVVPYEAWGKWNFVYKTILFAAFLPAVIRSRIQMEAVLTIIYISIAFNFIPFGLKTLISGGGYNREFGFIQGNSGLGEGSTLAAFSVVVIPLILFSLHFGKLFHKNLLTKAFRYGLIILAIAAAVGSFARTGLVASAVLATLFVATQKHRMRYFAAILATLAIAYLFVSPEWLERMQTITEYQGDTSALSRLAVWQWTIDYALAHPLGGGFNSYMINSITIPMQTDAGQIFVEHTGIAFHNMYIEVLGEHGFVGLAIYLLLLTTALLRLLAVIRLTSKDDSLAWAGGMARALFAALSVYMVAGNFIGVAFNPFLFYLIAMSISLKLHVDASHPNRQSSVLSSAPVSSPESVMGQ